MLPLSLTAETATASTVPEPFGKPSGPGLWHVKGMELPAYIQHVAHDLLDKGHAKDVSQAIQMAVGIVRKWSRAQTVGNERGHIHPDVKAAAVKAMAEWDAKRARAHTQHASHEHTGGTHMESVDLARQRKVGPQPSGAARQYETGRKTQGEAGHPAPEAGKPVKEAGNTGSETLDQQAQATAVASKTRLIGHLRNVHRLSGSHEHMDLNALQDLHTRDHASGEIMPHTHPPGLEPRPRKKAQPVSMANTIGTQMRFNAWGGRLDLATSTVSARDGVRTVSQNHSHGGSKVKVKGKYMGFKELVKKLMTEGKSKEEAMSIAADIGRKKYGGKAFQAAAAQSRKMGMV